jgi:hypothetical protein
LDDIPAIANFIEQMVIKPKAAGSTGDAVAAPPLS